MIYLIGLNLLLTFFITIKLYKMTAEETAEFTNLNTKLDTLKNGLDTSLAALAQAKSDLAAIQAQTSDADVLAALKAAEDKIDAANAEIATALAPAGN